MDEYTSFAEFADAVQRSGIGYAETIALWELRSNDVVGTVTRRFRGSLGTAVDIPATRAALSLLAGSTTCLAVGAGQGGVVWLSSDGSVVLQQYDTLHARSAFRRLLPTIVLASGARFSHDTYVSFTEDSIVTAHGLVCDVDVVQLTQRVCDVVLAPGTNHTARFGPFQLAGSAPATVEVDANGSIRVATSNSWSASFCLRMVLYFLLRSPDVTLLRQDAETMEIETQTNEHTD